MKNQVVLSKMCLIALYSAITCILPVIGPSVYAYMLASSSFFNKVASISKAKLLGSIIFGIIFFTVLFELKDWSLSSTLTFFFWNVAFVIIFFYVGVYIRKKRDAKVKAQIPNIMLPNIEQVPLINRVTVAIYSTSIEGTAKDYFSDFNVSFDKICLSEKQLDENKDYLLKLSSGSFIALFEKTNSYFVYHALKDVVNILRLEDEWPTFNPKENVKVIVRRPND